MEYIYNLVQAAEPAGRSNYRKLAIAKAKREAKRVGLPVYIEERRVTMMVRPDGFVVGGDE